MSMNQVLIVIVLTWLRQSPPEPTAQTGDSCAACHAAYQVDTTPGTHTVSAGCLSCHAPHEIKEGKWLPTKPPTDEQCLECHSKAIEAAAHPLRARLSEPQLK